MRKIFHIILIISMAGILFTPLISFAGAYQADGKTVEYNGLVPCGRALKVDGGYLNEQSININKETPPGYGIVAVSPDGLQKTVAKEIPCQFCHFFVMFGGIVDWAIGLFVPVVTVLMLVVAGIMFYLSGPNPNLLKTAQKIIWSVVWALVMIFGAYIIVNTILTFSGLVNFDFGGADFRNWFQINCSIRLPSP